MNKAKEYWKANIQLVVICIAIWFIVSFGFGILLAEPLNSIRLGGYKLGFWFAQPTKSTSRSSAMATSLASRGSLPSMSKGRATFSAAVNSIFWTNPW